MATIIAVLLFLVFLFLSLLHFYWAFGGKWGTEGVYPTTDAQTPPRNPGIRSTLIVAFGLFGFSIFYLIKVNIIFIELPL